MTIDIKKTLLLLGSSALLFTACGDDGGTPANPDAAVEQPDGAPGDPDAAPPDPTFGGTLSLAEVTVTNPEAAAVGGLSGANATISFTDPADVTVPPQPGYDNNIGACKIFVYDVAGGESAPNGSDGGAVTVTGTNAGAFGCAYNATLDRYLCSSADAAAAGAMAMAGTSMSSNANGTVNLTIPGADFSGASYRGMYIAVGGFLDANANGQFPILGQGGGASGVLVLGNAKLVGATTLAADSAYQTFVGAGPIPQGYDFLDDGTNDVVFAKDAETNAPAVDTTLKANGEGFTLSDESAQPHLVPTTGAAVTFDCGGTNGTCGAVAANSALKGIVVFGSTTDGVLPTGAGASFSDMPDPVSSFATFQCSGIGAESITLDAGAMALILGTNPTRIQTSVTYANAAIAGKNNILLSHGVVGFTTVEP